MTAITILSTQRRDDRTGVRTYCDSLEAALKGVSGCSVRRYSHHECSAAVWRRWIVLLKLSRLLGRGMQQVVQRWMIYGCAKSCIRMNKIEGLVLAQDPITGAAANRLGLKVWTTCHFSDPIEEIFRATPFSGVFRLLMRRSMRWFLAQNARYGVLTKNVAEVMRRYSPQSEINVVPTICRFDHFYEPVPHEGFRIVMAGRLEHLKGQDRLVRMMVHVKDNTVSLWLMGEGPDRAALEKLASDLGVEDRVKFLGFVEKPEDVYRQCDLYIHSSRMECMPLAPIEAVVCGVPAWCYEFPGWNDNGIFDGTPLLNDLSSLESVAGDVERFVATSAVDRRKLLESQRQVACRYLRGEAVREIMRMANHG